jgi:hypothetical protein
MLFLVKNSLGEKGSVRWYVDVMQQPVLFVVKVRGKVFAYFNAVVTKCHGSKLKCVWPARMNSL